MNWAILIMACIFEVGWTIGLKYAQGILQWSLTVISIVGSAVFFIIAMKRLPASFAYITFVTLGMIGSYIADVAWFGKTVHLLSAVSILTMLFCIIKLDGIKETLIYSQKINRR